MRSLAEIIIIMPTEASSTRMGYSNFAMLMRVRKRRDSTMATAEPVRASTFINRAKSSTTKLPPNALTLPTPVPHHTIAAIRTSAAIARLETRANASLREKEPSINNAAAIMASKISGSAATASACCRKEVMAFTSSLGWLRLQDWLAPLKRISKDFRQWHRSHPLWVRGRCQNKL